MFPCTDIFEISLRRLGELRHPKISMLIAHGRFWAISSQARSGIEKVPDVYIHILGGAIGGTEQMGKVDFAGNAGLGSCEHVSVCVP